MALAQGIESTTFADTTENTGPQATWSEEPSEAQMPVEVNEQDLEPEVVKVSDAGENEDFLPAAEKETGDGGSASGPYPIGQVGLAAAREAPITQDAQPGSDEGQKTSDVEPAHRSEVAEPRVIENDAEQTNDIAASSPVKETAQSSTDTPTATTHDEQQHLTEVDSLEEVKQAGEVEEPESARSAPPPAANPLGPFGRIGHPGAGKHEMESPNPTLEGRGEQSGEDLGDKVEIEWNEGELKRDEAKTIVSPNAKKESKAVDDTTGKA